MTTVYGIKNCDTIKKTLKWFNDNSVEFTFHDYRKDGLDSAWLANVLNECGWEKILNKRGTTYRQLPDSDKENLDQGKALALLESHPAMIKRPIIQSASKTLVGYDVKELEQSFV